MTSARRRRCPMPRRSPGTCRSTTRSGARLKQQFSEPELVEIGYFVALTMGQQRWLRTLGIEHHQIMAGTDASMAPGFETAEALAASKERADYWARSNVAAAARAAE